MKGKIINISLAVLFALFAIVQINDPDPVLWVVIYGTVALVYTLRIFGLFRRSTVMIIFALISAYSLLHIGHFWEWLTQPNKMELFGSMIYDKPHIEGTREFGGLLHPRFLWPRSG